MTMGIIEHSHMDRILKYITDYNGYAGLSIIKNNRETGHWSLYIGNEDVILMEVNGTSFSEALAELSKLVHEETNKE